jgi:hypothetical protein
MALARSLLLWPPTIVCAACFDFPVPLSPPQDAVVDQRLLGVWRCVTDDPDGDKPMRLEFRRFDATQYEISAKAEGEETEAYRAHTSTIADRTFLNVREVDKIEEDGNWVYLKYDLLKDDVLDFEIVDPDQFKEKPQSSEAIRSALERDIGNPELLARLCLCLRVNEPTQALTPTPCSKE